MRRALVLGLASAMALAGVAAAVGSPAWKAPPFQSIGIAQVGVFSNEFSDEGDLGFDVIIPTGSRSPYCLATVTEASEVYGVLPTVFCNARQTEIDGVLVPGLRLTIAYDAPIPRDYFIALNVYQEGARYYGEPLRCSVVGCLDY